jgi:hypothetical protein
VKLVGTLLKAVRWVGRTVAGALRFGAPLAASAPQGQPAQANPAAAVGVLGELDDREAQTKQV